MGSERKVLSVARDGELDQAQTPTTDQPRTPHLETLRTRRLQFFSQIQSVQNSFSAPKSTAFHSDRPVSLDRTEAELDVLLLQDSSVPEHQKLRHVLAWAQNFIRTGPATPPESSANFDRVTCWKSSHVTRTHSTDLPTRPVHQSPQMCFSPESRPLSQPCSEPHPSPRPESQPCPEMHPLSQPNSEPHPFPRPQSQSCPDPRSFSQPLSDPVPKSHPLPRPLSQPCPEPHPWLRPHSQPRPQSQPGLGVYETYLMCVARLRGRETLAGKEAQLSCGEMTRDCKEALVGEREGRSQCVDTRENSCTNLTRVAGDFNSSNCEKGEGWRALADEAHSLLSIVEDVHPKSLRPVTAPADDRTAVLLPNVTTAHTTAGLPSSQPADHATTALPANAPAAHATTALPANAPAAHTTTALTANATADHTTTVLPANTLVEHTSTALPANAPADHRPSELPAPTLAEGPEREAGPGGQHCCHKGSNKKKSPVIEEKKPVAGSSWPRQAGSSASSRRRRFWEKSSLLWSSYPEGTLLPRMKSSTRPATASCSVTGWFPQDSALSLDSNLQNHVPGGTVCEQWLSLPDELWMSILKLISHSDLCHVAQTCRRLCRLANDKTLWRMVRIEKSTCLNADWLSSIGRRGPCSLTLYRCTDEHVTPQGLEALFAQSGGSLRELRIVSCSGLGLQGDKLLLPCSRYCPHLTKVDVSWTSATDTGIAALASAASSLENVVINGCSITDRVFKMIVKRHGGRLEVFGCRNLSAPCLSAMATGCPDLKVVNLGKLPKITESCLTFIIGRLKQLTSLDLTGLSVVRDQTVHQISRQCPKLQDLTLRCCPSVTDRSLIEISTYSASVRYLDVSGCSAVTDVGIHAISMACQHLQYLDLSSTKTSNKGVRLLASYGSRHLHTLKISFCYICQDSLRKLCRYHTGLRLLHLYGACDFHNAQELLLINPSLEAKCDLTCATQTGPHH